MFKMLCAATLLVAATLTSLGQTADNPAHAVPPEVVRDLAPTGRLRAAINVSNIVLAQRDPAGGDPHGITVDLARELARRSALQSPWRRRRRIDRAARR